MLRDAQADQQKAQKELEQTTSSNQSLTLELEETKKYTATLQGDLATLLESNNKVATQMQEKQQELKKIQVQRNTVQEEIAQLEKSHASLEVQLTVCTLLKRCLTVKSMRKLGGFKVIKSLYVSCKFVF